MPTEVHEEKFGIEHLKDAFRTLCRTSVWIVKVKHPESPGGEKIVKFEWVTFPYIPWIQLVVNFKVAGEEVLDLSRKELPQLIEVAKEEFGELPYEKIKHFTIRTAENLAEIADSVWDEFDAIKELLEA